MRLTPNMRDALTAASRQELRRTHTLTPGADPWPHPAASLHALVRRGLLSVGEIRNRHGLRVTIWAITDAGRQALEPPPRVIRDPVRLLRVGSGTTMPMVGGIWQETRVPEPEQMLPSARWQNVATDRMAEAQDRRAAARRLVASRRAA